MAYRHAPGCNWPTKHPDYRSSGTPGVLGGAPTVLVNDPKHGTCLEPCACWQASYPSANDLRLWSADLALWRYCLTWVLAMCGTEAVREILDAQNRSYEAARRRGGPGGRT